MSELRDLTLALRSFDKRLTGVETCLIELLRDSKQQSEWRHWQKNQAMIDAGAEEERVKAIQQVQLACGSISDRLTAIADIRLADVKELKERVRTLEQLSGQEEVTKV